MATMRWSAIPLAVLALPMVAYVALTYVLAAVLAVPLLISGVAVRRLHWAVPFLPALWRHNGPVRGEIVMALVFHYCYCWNLARRFLTLPLRPHLPAFYIVGFPVEP